LLTEQTLPMSVLALGLELGQPLVAVAPAAQAVFAAGAQPLEQRSGRRPGVTVHADGDLLHEAQHAVVGIDLDHCGVRGPVLDPVLGKGPEGPEAAAQGQHRVGLGDDAHRRLRALVAEGSAQEGV
jgi:hypothetical protein